MTKQEVNKLLALMKANYSYAFKSMSQQDRYYKATDDIVSLQRILCHSSSRETLLYIGVIQEEIDNSLRGFKTVW